MQKVYKSSHRDKDLGAALAPSVGKKDILKEALH